MKLDSMNLGSTAIAVRKTEVEQGPGFKKVSDTYNEHAKLVFLFDVSGSMNSCIVTDSKGRSYIDQFLWPETTLNDIKQRVAAVIAKVSGAPATTSSLDDEGDDADAGPALDPDEQKISILIDITGMPRYTNDDELKALVVQHGLTDFFGVLPNTMTQSKHQEPPTRIGIVRKLARQEINNRFAKYPKSRIAVLPFSGITATLFDDGAPEEVNAAIDKLDANLYVDNKNAKGEVTSRTYMDGGTNIMEAIASGMELCRKAPSAVGIHHFILVTDGEDSSTYTLPEWVPNMKASGIVLDYIHIGDSTPNEDLNRACKELGGEYVSVNSEMEFESKFVQAVHRPLLPAASK